MKATKVKPEERKPNEFTCVVCKKKTTQPYGLLRNGECVCTGYCNQVYLSGRSRDVTV